MKKEIKKKKLNPNPCPFCKSKDICVEIISPHFKERRIVCSKCGKDGPPAKKYEDAVKNWNDTANDRNFCKESCPFCQSKLSYRDVFCKIFKCTPCDYTVNSSELKNYKKYAKTLLEKRGRNENTL